jgi:hypothetical protein
MEGNWDYSSRAKNNNNRNNNNNNNNGKWDTTKKSHFINIPILDTSFIDGYVKFMEVFKTSNVNNFYPELLQKPGKLHMTVCTLDIGEDDEKIQKVHKILLDLQPEIKKLVDGKVFFNFEKFETMEKVTSTRVVYAKMIEDEYYQKLEEVIHLILKTLIEQSIIDKNKLNEVHIDYDKDKDRYSIKLHMTLLNVMFLNKILKKTRQKQVFNLDATDIMDHCSKQILPPAEITQIHFSRMREDKVTEKYELLYSYDIY